MHTKRIALLLPLCLLALLAPLGAGTQVERQRRQNEEWRKAAEQRQEQLYNRAREYEREGDFANAIRFYQRVMGVYYSQWELREISGGRFDAGGRSDRTAQQTATLRRTRVLLRGARYTAAERRIEQLVRRRVAGALDSIEDMAKEARRENNYALEHARYQQLLRAAARARTQEAERYAQRARGRMEAIERDALRTLERIESDLESERNAERAVANFREFEEQYGAFDATEAVRDKYVALTRNPKLTKIRGAADAEGHIEQAEAYYEEGEYGYAYYEFLIVTDLFGASDAAEEARRRLTEIERDPEILLEVHQTSRERYARELLRRAGEHMEKADTIAARRLYEYVATRFADCVAARHALNRLSQFED